MGFRGRAAGCDCGKWLSPGGSRMILFNGERLGQGPGMGVAAGARRAAGRILYVVENPIDCILLERVLWDGVAVATLGVSMWQDAWTEAVARSGARRVIVAFDNDRPGNGGGERGRAAWLESHPRDIEPNGVRLVNRLRAAGVDACLYPWPENAPLKADVGDLLAEVA